LSFFKKVEGRTNKTHTQVLFVTFISLEKEIESFCTTAFSRKNRKNRSYLQFREKSSILGLRTFVLFHPVCINPFAASQLRLLGRERKKTFSLHSLVFEGTKGRKTEGD